MSIEHTMKWNNPHSSYQKVEKTFCLFFSLLFFFFDYLSENEEKSRFLSGIEDNFLILSIEDP